MLEYDPQKKELSSRDVVARSIYKEVLAGRGSEHGGAYLDITHRGADYIKHKLPSMYEQFHTLANVDITKEAMEVAPTIHYAMGGIRVDPETEATNIPGLYAAGEAAAGLHGSNRLGGNSLSDILVFGRRAGRSAAQHAQARAGLLQVDETAIEEEQKRLFGPLQRAAGENPFKVHEELQAIMAEHVGIARDEAGLKEAVEQILTLRERAAGISVSGGRVFNPGWNIARDDLFMLTVAEAITRAAVERRESRGSHWRLDYPEKSADMERVNFVTRRGDTGEMVVTSTENVKPPDKLKQLVAA